MNTEILSTKFPDWEIVEDTTLPWLLKDFTSMTGRIMMVAISRSVLCMTKCKLEKHFMQKKDFEATPADVEFVPLAFIKPSGGVEVSSELEELFASDVLEEIITSFMNANKYLG